MAVEFVLARVVRRELGEFEARVFTDVSGPKRVKARSTRSFDRERRARQVAHSEHVSVPERELELVRDVNKKNRRWTPARGCQLPPLGQNLRPVIHVQLTRHLFAFFPQLEGRALEVDATDVAGVLRELESIAPGIGFYLCDERGRLRPHVNVFIGNAMVRDRRQLSDAVTAGDKVSILQALSGG